MTRKKVTALLLLLGALLTNISYGEDIPLDIRLEKLVIESFRVLPFTGKSLFFLEINGSQLNEKMINELIAMSKDGVFIRVLIYDFEGLEKVFHLKNSDEKVLRLRSFNITVRFYPDPVSVLKTFLMVSDPEDHINSKYLLRGKILNKDFQLKNTIKYLSLKENQDEYYFKSQKNWKMAEINMLK